MEKLPVILMVDFSEQTLLESVIKEFEKESIDYYFNQSIPINDMELALDRFGFYRFRVKPGMTLLFCLPEFDSGSQR